ncbi:hypothetical protein FRB93_000711 [Tulasnella sp. JGI-2019a]|nr:hypothetical protein FRB93_000711 [Tulasnella sp. JGI-2019a]
MSFCGSSSDKRNIGRTGNRTEQPISGNSVTLYCRDNLANEIATPSLVLRDQLSNFAFIHRLPVELLIKIFICAVEIDGLNTPDDYQDSVLALALVCKAWAEITRSPELWTVVIDSNSSPKNALDRSASRLLVVKTGLNTDPCFWQAVTRNLHRWQSASLSIDSDAQISALEMDGAPELTEPRLTAYWDHEENPGAFLEVDLFQGNAPKLESLELSYLGLRNWGSNILSGLHDIHLHHIFCPSTTDILAVLFLCPRIETLEIYDVRF